MLEGMFTQKTEQLRRPLHQCLHGRIFGIQNPQWIAVQTALRFCIQLVAMLLEIGNQGAAMRLPFRRYAQTVYFDADIAQPQICKKIIYQQHQLGIDLWPRETECLGTQLVKLPIASTLGPLMPKHRPHVIKALSAVISQVVLDSCTHHARRVFRAKRELLTVEAVFKGVHLLFNNVSRFTRAAHKQRSRLQNGRAYVSIGIAPHQGTHLVFEPLPSC